MSDGAIGDCFEAAFNHLAEVAIDDPYGERFMLVHGNVADLPQHSEVNHAWVEEGETVHEVSNGQNLRIPKAAYYKRQRITKARRYSLLDAMGKGEKHKGPWDS